MKNDNPVIFETLLGAKWQSLPIALKRHYNIRAFNNDNLIVTGTITVEVKGIMKWLSPLLGVMGMLPPFAEQDIPIEVTFSTKPSSNAFYFSRTFHYRHHDTYLFNSKMIPVGGNELVDLTRSHLGWRMAYDFIDNQITLTHRGYVFTFFKWFIPLPIEWLVGRCDSYEEAIADNAFKMSMEFKHPWFGVLYAYYGNFKFMD